MKGESKKETFTFTLSLNQMQLIKASVKQPGSLTQIQMSCCFRLSRRSKEESEKESDTFNFKKQDKI